MFRRRTVAGCVLALSLLPGGCHEGEIDGAIVRAVSITRAGGLPVFPGGSDCNLVRRGTSHGSESRQANDVAVFHDISEKGRVRTKIYVRPLGLPPDVELTVDNGELARDDKFNRDSFVDEEVIHDVIVTYDDDVIDIEYFFSEDCENIEYPGGTGG